jgi:chorismate dehydratase
MKINIGQINFINCLPINLPLARLGLLDNLEYEIFDSVPSDLNQKLFCGELDIAPISSYEYLINKDKYQYLDGISISSKKEADSVLFFCDLAFWSNPNKVIHVTNKSATSVNLLKILIKEFYKFDLSQISFEVFDLNQKYQAKLLIGDEALQEDKTQYEEVIDLGAKWFELTCLPMVFGLWTINKSSELFKNQELVKEVNERFLELRDKGFNEFYPDMIIEAFKKTGLSKTVLKKYFSNLDYSFSDKHKESLDFFESYLTRQLFKIN